MPETSGHPFPSLSSSDVVSPRPRFVLDRKVSDYLKEILKAFPVDIRGVDHVDLAFLSGQATLARDLLALSNQLGETDGK